MSRPPARPVITYVAHVTELANQKGCTPGQLALAWVHARGHDIVPIPGTKRRAYLEENVAAMKLSLSAAELAKIDEIAPKGVAAGERYPAMAMPSLNR